MQSATVELHPGEYCMTTVRSDTEESFTSQVFISECRKLPSHLTEGFVHDRESKGDGRQRDGTGSVAGRVMMDRSTDRSAHSGTQHKPWQM